MGPLLSIYIPSWNRSNHFNNLIQSIAGQITPQVEVVASLNPPNLNYYLPEWVKVVQQQFNIGGRTNISLGPVLCAGEYIWMIGDDDLVLPGGIQAVLEAIRNKPGIIVMSDGHYQLGAELGKTYATYRDFGDTVYGNGRGHTLSAITLMSATVFRREGFNLETCLIKTDTMYGQHYGMLENLWREPVSIVNQPTFRSAIAGQSASIFQAPPEEIHAHMSRYPAVMNELCEWINELTGSSYEPQHFWYPGCGFDK